MGTFYNFSVLRRLTPPNVTVISDSVITGFVAPISLETLQIWISFDVTGKYGSPGFCRLSIPPVVMGSTFQVIVNSTEISYTLLSCSNSTVSYIHFTYTYPTEQVTIVPEFPSFLILPLLVITLFGVIVLKKKTMEKEG